MKFKSAPKYRLEYLLVPYAGCRNKCSRIDSVLCEHPLDSFDESLRVELRAHDVVRAIAERGNTPVTDKSYGLVGPVGLYLGTKRLRVRNAALPFDIDQDEVIGAGLKTPESILRIGRRFHVVAGQAKNLVA
jgi:hypothetical protein